jgi:site-specific DNA-methyltransferase (adenine-specific)|tara:strand:- start:2003 stop:2833 length:831 start_codon:yes stop_codon:yes gene_type:complete
MNKKMNIENIDGIELLKKLSDNSVDLILTDPPYIISRDSGMNNFKKEVQKIDESGENKKTEADWEIFKKDKTYNAKAKKNYIKYGNTSGKKYGYKTDYGEWDKEFTIEKLEEFIKLFYKKLKKGGTCIIFFDIWKIETLKKIMETAKTNKNGFKQIRFIEWIKTNPIPLNQSVNYLTNCREIALLGVKGGKPTFNSKYDKGIYDFPIQNGKNRFHPTQKSIPLFEELIKKHSNEGDLIVDPFLGGGTTAIACKNTNRNFSGCEIDKSYFDKVINIL